MILLIDNYDSFTYNLYQYLGIFADDVRVVRNDKITTDEIRQIAKDVYEQTGLDFTGIDLLFGKDRFYLCEINVMPGLEGIEQATGVNVAGRMMDMICGDF